MNKAKPKPLSKKQQLASDWKSICDKWATAPKFSSPSMDRSKRHNPIADSPPRITPHYPSRVSPGGSTGLSAAPRYTGGAMIGIATLHKSNSVPVFTQQDAEDISKMRRG